MSHTLLSQICAIPTAPFAEKRVIEWVLRWAKMRKRIAMRRDDVGNILLELPGVSRGPRTVLVAHMDHPGFTATTMQDRRTLRARFNGGVSATFFKGERIRFFTDSQDVVGTVLDVDLDPASRPVGATLGVRSSVTPGSIGMWDQGEPVIKRHRFSCRVCDDLAGVAAAIAVLDALSRSKLSTPVCVLLTRAEEEGFIGAIAAVQNPKLLRPTDLVISLECSADQSYAKQGEGVVLRTGDRTSIFNSALTRFMQMRGEALAIKDRSFIMQRALMPGGTCEATVFDAWNYCAAAVCIPLGNYHNMNRATGKIGPEYIDLRDWDSMVKLLIDVARHAVDFSGDHADLRHKLTRRFECFKSLL